MARFFGNRAWMTTATVGTGTITLGSAVAAYQSFADAGIANADTVGYLILDTGNAWEVGIGMYTSAGTTLARSVIESSNADNPISLSGSATVQISELAADFYRTEPRGLTIDGGGSTITTGIRGDLYLPDACIITGVVMLADQSGSIVIDIWRDTYTNYPPVVGDSITASAKPTISSATKSKDTTLTGWSLACPADSTLRFNVDSVTTITRCTLTLSMKVPG